MTRFTNAHQAHGAAVGPLRRAFSFAEVLFATVILGIGFILIAAIFPVAISQTRATVDEAAAAAAARQAAGIIAAVPTVAPNPLYVANATPTALLANPAIGVAQTTLFPPTVKNWQPATPPTLKAPPAIVVPLTGRALEAVRGNLIDGTDPRFAYVPFYRRENNSNVAQLIVIAIAARNRPTYDPAVDAAVPVTSISPNALYNGPLLTLTQRSVINNMVTPDTVTLSGANPGWITEGCGLLTNPGTGRTLRLGRAIDTSTTSSPVKFEVDPGDTPSVAPGPDGLWGTTDDIRDTTAPAMPVLPPATVQPIGAYAAIYSAPGSIAGRITISDTIGHAVASTTTAGANVPPPAAVPGAFIIVADDYPYDSTSPTVANYALPTSPAIGTQNGQIYRLGPAVPADTTATPPVPPGTFELDPQFATVPTGQIVLPLPIPGSTTHGRVYLVGAGRAKALSVNDPTPTATLTTYAGPAQDVGVYTTVFAAQ